MSPIDKKYAELGGEKGFLGKPETTELTCPDGVGRYRHYQRGSIYWHPSTGAYEVHGSIRQKWSQLGWEKSFLGYPATDETMTPDGEGRFNHFQHGSIYWHPGTGAYEVHGSIRQKWSQLGWGKSFLGYPATDETKTPDGEGRFNHFQHGSIYWHPKTGAYEVARGIREKWAQYGWEKGFLGYPVSSPSTTDVGFQQQFQGGLAKENSKTEEIRMIKKATPQSPNYSAPVYAIQVSDDDGKRAAQITPQEIQKWLDWANQVYAIAGLEFTYDGKLETLKNTKVNNVPGEDYAYWNEVKDLLNAKAKNKGLLVAFRYGANGPVGGGFSSHTYNFVVMPGFSVTTVCGKQNIGLLAHEMGHYFGLSHTFGPQFETRREAVDYFLSHFYDPTVFDGDKGTVSDTPPDPYIAELQCDTKQKAVVLAGVSFNLCRDNVISYWASDFPPSLSHLQMACVRGMLETRVSKHGLVVHKKTA